MGNSCKSCMTRTPYATLIGAILCLAGSGVFCISFYRGLTYSRAMFEEVFHFRVEWLRGVQLAFVIVGGVTAAVGLMILFVGFLATGETRTSVYRAWQSQVGGRISCAVFIAIAYILKLFWIGLFGILVVTTMVFNVCWSLCVHKKPPFDAFNCIDFQQFHFLFPYNTRQEDMKVCEAQEIKPFCKDYVERGELMFFIATIATGVIILSLVQFLMALSANYAHIRDHKKLRDYQDFYYHNAEPEETALTGSHGKDRYEDEGQIYVD